MRSPGDLSSRAPGCALWDDAHSAIMQCPTVRLNGWNPVPNRTYTNTHRITLFYGNVPDPGPYAGWIAYTDGSARFIDRTTPDSGGYYFTP